MSSQKIDISWTALLRIVALGVGLYLAVRLNEIILMLFGVFVAVSALNPIVQRWQKRLSRPWAVALLYLLMGVLVAAASWLIIPAFLEQLYQLAGVMPQLASSIQEYSIGLQGTQFGDLVVQGLGSLRGLLLDLPNQILHASYALLGGFATFVTAIVLSFYLLLEEGNARTFVNQILPHGQYAAAYTAYGKLSERMGAWVRGQLLLMLIMGVANLIIYLSLGLPSPLPLALWAGLCEIVPIIGPFLAVLPALGVAAANGNWVTVLLVAVLSTLAQQLEGHIVVPRVMAHAVGLSPVLVILALTVGAQLFGLVGALIAVPVAAAAAVVAGEWSSLRRMAEKPDHAA